MDLLKFFTMVLTVTCVVARSSQKNRSHLQSFIRTSSMTLTNEEMLMPIEIKVMANKLYQLLQFGSNSRPSKKFFWKSRTIRRS